jgi:hypothetical protein
MGYHEQIWIDQFPSTDLLYYSRYVDDIFCVFNDEASAERFFEFMNKRHVNIGFTMEKEILSSIPFLDVLITRDDNRLLTNVYRKKSYTGLLTNFFSFTAQSYKVGLIRCLIDRAFKICSTWNDFKHQISEISVILQKNQFPCTLVEKFVSDYLSRIVQLDTIDNVISPIKYFSVPFIGHFSIVAQKRLGKIVKRYCYDLDIRLAFSSFKVGHMFSAKDRLPLFSRSHVVYKFCCAGCGACYIGETRRHLNTRISEHVHNKGSNIHKHLQDSPNCKEKFSVGDFCILDTAKTDTQLKLKEALHIYWCKPSLNVQVHHLELSLF